MTSKWRAYTILAALAIMVIVLTPYIATAVRGEAKITRYPFSLSNGAILYDGTIVGFKENKLIFYRNGVIFKEIALIGNPKFLMVYPEDNPYYVIAVTDAGDILIATPEKVLYETIVGFGTLEKACYSKGNVYMLISTAQGKMLYILNIPSRSWWLIAPRESVGGNIHSLLTSYVLDLICSSDYTAVLITPLAPPAQSYDEARFVILTPNGTLPLGSPVIIYYPDDGYTVEYYSDEKGTVIVQVPLPPRHAQVYVTYGNTTFMVFNDTLTPGLHVVTITESTPQLPPPTEITRLLVILDGTTVKSTFRVERAEEILSLTGSYIVLYAGASVVDVYDINGTKIAAVMLDGAPVSCSGYSGILAVGTKPGTVYVFNLSTSALLTTISVPNLKVVAVTKDYVYAVGNNVHAISLKSFKDVFLYTEPGLPISSDYFYVNPAKNIIMFSTKDSTLVIEGLTETEPFKIETLVPYIVTIKVETPWGTPVPNASIFVDGIYIGKTNENGTITMTMTYGNHTFEVTPPPSLANVTSVKKSIYVNSSGTYTITLKRSVFYLTVNVVGEDGQLIEPVKIEIVKENKTLYRFETVRGMVTATVKPGEYTIIVTPITTPPAYYPAKRTIVVKNDTNVTITLKYVYYPVTIKVKTKDTGELIPAKICVGSKCTNSTVISLHKGAHVVTVTPLVKYNDIPIYKQAKITVVVPRDKEVEVLVERINAILNITFIDQITKKPITTPLTVKINGLPFRVTNGKLTVVVPLGKVNIAVEGTEKYASYKSTISVSGDKNVTIELPRKSISVTVQVQSWFRVTPQGTVIFQSLENPSVKFSYAYDASSLKEGKLRVKIPLGRYEIKFIGAGFKQVSEVQTIDKPTFIILLASPTLQRFLMSNIQLILGVIAITVSLIAVFWMFRTAKKRIKETEIGRRIIGEA